MSKLVLLTGSPGVGKTTLIKKLTHKLKDNYYQCNGFYTEDVRNGENTRIGFDVVGIEKTARAILSRDYPHEFKAPRVGKYYVHTKSFENFALPLMNWCEGQEFLVIDEVGKMEVFSKRFVAILRGKILPALDRNQISLLVTIPQTTGANILIVNTLKMNPKAVVYCVTRENRDHIFDEIYNYLIK